MVKVYFAWIGSTDVHGLDFEEGTGYPGPITAALQSEFQFDRVVLLHNRSVWRDHAPGEFARRLEARTGYRAELLDAGDLEPFDFSAVYGFTMARVHEILKNCGPRQLYFHASPGTVPMAISWLMLAAGCGAGILVSSEAGGVRLVRIREGLPAALYPDERMEDLSASVGPVHPAFENILCSCRVMRTAVERAQFVAERNLPVLLEGETGTGKELFARAIHKASGRRGKFVAVNCGAIPRDLIASELFGHTAEAFTGARKSRPGYFREAGGGTIFLDEIGELPLDMQATLLRALQEHEVTPVGSDTSIRIDARIIAAGNRNLLEEVAAGRFRSDLYYRLSVADITLPPLRERTGDLPLLLKDALEKANHEIWGDDREKYRIFSSDAEYILSSYSWPGNVRELYGTVMRIVLWSKGKKICAEDSSEALRKASKEIMEEKIEGAGEFDLHEGFNLSKKLKTIEEGYLREAFELSHGSLKEGSRMLGIANYQTYSSKLRSYGIR